MKKLLLLIVIVAGATFSASAQSSSSETGKFSVGAEVGLPLGKAKEAYNLVVGGSLKYEHPIATGTFVTISAGYNAFLTKSEYKDLGLKSSIGWVPVKAGLKYYFDGVGFFGEAQLGAAFSTETGGGTAFAYSPGVGYSFDGGFEAGLRYEAYSKSGSSTQQLGLRLAYRF